MEMEKLKQFGDLSKKVKFMNISDGEQSFFDWKSEGTFFNYSLELNNIRKNDNQEYYFSIIKGDYKIVYIKRKNLYYTIGVDIELQKQLVEAILDAIIQKFNEAYDFDIIFSYGGMDPSIFKNFSTEIETILREFEELDLVRKVRISCTVCIQMFSIVIKRTTIEKALHYPVPVVCTHLDHDLLVYIDREYKVRGMSPITFA